MNFNEELAMAGILELNDNELETVSGGWERPWHRYNDDDYNPYWYQPYWYQPVPWWEQGFGWGGDWEHRHGHEGGNGEHHDVLHVRTH